MKLSIEDINIILNMNKKDNDNDLEWEWEACLYTKQVSLHEESCPIRHASST